MRTIVGVIAGVVALVGVAACGDDGGEGGSAAAEPGGVSGEVVVFAAASLTEAFDELGDAFEAAHPDVSLAFNYAGSSTLAEQIRQGAPADVFASADHRNMDVVVDAELAAGEPVDFATNALTIAVEPGNPLGIGDVGDLVDPSFAVVLCDPDVPCGGFALELFDKAGVDVEAKSLETDVKAVLTKVSLGEADAGIVYETDVRAAGGDVAGVSIPPGENVTARYPVAALADARNEDGAAAFVEFVTSREAWAVLESYGFGTP